MTDEETVIALYRAENQAMVDGDLKILNKILAQTMSLTHMTGLVQPKLTWIDQIQNGEMKYYFSKEDSIRDIVIKGRQASLVGQNQVEASIWGSARTLWHLQMKMNFVKEGDEWMISSQIASTY